MNKEKVKAEDKNQMEADGIEKDAEEMQSKKLLPSPLQLTKQAASSFIKHKKALLFIGLVQLFVASVIRIVLFQQPVQAGIYIGMIGLLGVLAYIWAIRHLENDENIDTRDAFYIGTAPVVKFLLLLMLIMLQLIPFSIGAVIFATATVGQAVNTLDLLFLSLIWIVLSIPSFYWITSSFVGLFIVTLPKVRPLEALEKAKDLVREHRMKLFFNIFYILIISLIILVLILVASVFLPSSLLEISLLGTTFFTAQIIQYVVTTLLIVPFTTLYLFKVYKSLVEGRNEERRSQKEN